MNIIYLVREVCEDEYGYTEPIAAFTNKKTTERFVEENQYTVKFWFSEEPKPALSILTMPVDEYVERK